jgi:hypothetical protein
VVDDEMPTWHDSLHRFDRIAQEHSNIKPQNEAIIAGVDKLYSYKTINYTKNLRVSSLFIDCAIEKERHAVFRLRAEPT